MQRLANKIALVTGASKGIGKAIAVAFGREGANVVVTARTRSVLQALAQQLTHMGVESLAVPADLAVASDIQRIAEEALARFGRIDILVNNAAIIHPSTDLVEFEATLWRQVIEVNLSAAALLTKAVLPSMIAQRSGKILNISSRGGRKGGKGCSAYRVTKAGLISLTESVAAEVQPYGIRVNCICPGVIVTPLAAGRPDASAERLDKFRQESAPVQPLGRAGEPVDIAKAALWLASDESSFVTGQVLSPNGGVYMSQ